MSAVVLCSIFIFVLYVVMLGVIVPSVITPEAKLKINETSFGIHKITLSQNKLERLSVVSI